MLAIGLSACDGFKKTGGSSLCGSSLTGKQVFTLAVYNYANATCNCKDCHSPGKPYTNWDQATSDAAYTQVTRLMSFTDPDHSVMGNHASNTHSGASQTCKDELSNSLRTWAAVELAGTNAACPTTIPSTGTNANYTTLGVMTPVLSSTPATVVGTTQIPGPPILLTFPLTPIGQPGAKIILQFMRFSNRVIAADGVTVTAPGSYEIKSVKLISPVALHIENLRFILAAPNGDSFTDIDFTTVNKDIPASTTGIAISTATSVIQQLANSGETLELDVMKVAVTTIIPPPPPPPPAELANFTANVKPILVGTTGKCQACHGALGDPATAAFPLRANMTDQQLRDSVVTKLTLGANVANSLFFQKAYINPGVAHTGLKPLVAADVAKINAWIALIVP